MNRYKTLVAKDEISRQQYDQAVATLATAHATIESKKAAVTEAQQSVSSAEVAVEQAKAKLAQADATVEGASTGPEQLSMTRSRVQVAQAKVAQQQAALDQAELNLSYVTITAPADGVVGKVGVNPGQNVQAGQEMMALIPLDGLWVTANFKENQLRTLKSGQKVEIKVDANGREYKGHVRARGGRERRADEPAASRKRDRQLRESGPAHSGADLHRSRPESGSCAAAWDVGDAGASVHDHDEYRALP